jgi:hypothetical protein
MGVELAQPRVIFGEAPGHAATIDCDDAAQVLYLPERDGATFQGRLSAQPAGGKDDATLTEIVTVCMYEGLCRP